MADTSSVSDRNTSSGTAAAAWWQCEPWNSNGSSHNKTDCVGGMEFSPEVFDVLKSKWAAVLVFFVYVTVIIVGAAGNIIVVLTVVKTRQLWNATNTFIANLALADIFVCVFDMPFNLHYQLTDSWAFGAALCHVIPMAFAVVVYVSTLTMTLIAVDRYVLILFPLKKRMSVKVALLFVCVIAAVAICVALPIGMYSTESALPYSESIVCSEKWPQENQRLVYTCLTLLFQFFIPLLIIVCLYALIFHRVRARMSACASTRRKTKTTKMVVAVVVVFALTWTPFHLYTIISESNYDLVKGKYYRLVDCLLRALAMSSSCINPFLYGWMNDNYRNAFLSIIKRPYATPTGIQREDSEITKKTVINPSPDRNQRSQYRPLKSEICCGQREESSREQEMNVFEDKCAVTENGVKTSMEIGNGETGLGTQTD